MCSLIRSQLFRKLCFIGFGNFRLSTRVNLALNRSEYNISMKVDVSNQDRRKTPRKHLQFPAWVEGAHNEPLECAVVDMTLKGARLRAPNAALPNEFTVLPDNKSSLKRRCRVIWRKRFTVGLEFVQGG
jgi:PilZ domain